MAKALKITLLFLCIMPETIATEITIPASFGIDFHTSMEITNLYSRRTARLSKIWQTINQRYTQYINKNVSLPSEPLIPKIIHQIWLGSSLPKHCKTFQTTWIKHHPDWTYFFWTDTISEETQAQHPVLRPSSLDDIIAYLALTPLSESIVIIDIRNLDFSTRKHFDARHNFGEKSDILRYEILFYLGGLYADTDFECLQSFNIFNYVCELYAGADYRVDHFAIYNSLIASRAHHPVLNGCINAIRNQQPFQTSHTGEAIMARTGPFLLTQQILNHINTHEDRTIIFPATYFYPWPNIYRTENNRAQIEKWIRPESYGIHHWHVSWLPQ